MDKCNSCGSILLNRVNFDTNKEDKICCSCTNTDPRSKEIVNASIPKFNCKLEPVIYDPNYKLPPFIPEYLKPKINTDNLSYLATSTKPDLEIRSVELAAAAETDYIHAAGRIKINWDDVIGYPEIKYVINQALNTRSDKKTHILIIGAAGTSKTVFLKTVESSLLAQGIKCIYRDASTMTSSGLIDYLFNTDIDNAVIEIDEIDKLEKKHQSVFLNMLETGTLQETKNKKIREKSTHNVLVLATGNYKENILEPLRTRFLPFEIPQYTQQQFMDIGRQYLIKKFKKTPENADYIVSTIWNTFSQRGKTPNLRYARQVAELTTNDRVGIDLMLSAISKYSKDVTVDK